MLTIIGILIIISIVTLLMMGKVSPIIAMSCIPLLVLYLPVILLLKFQYSLKAALIKSQSRSYVLFAILFFSLMKDLHIFDPLIRLMVKMTRGNIIVVCIMTTLIAGIVHLDGSGAATFLIIIPALLPLYRQLGMSLFNVATDVRQYGCHEYGTLGRAIRPSFSCNRN